MVSRSFGALQGSGRSRLDLPVAALAGLAVAFLAFAAPANLLGELVDASGLPSVVSAAQPPLGFKARIGLGAVGAVVMFAITLLVLRWLERFGRRPVKPIFDPVIEAEAPRLRRRDSHPDAPARPLLLASHELGEPGVELGEDALFAEPAAPASPLAVWDMPDPHPWMADLAPGAELPAALEPEPAEAAPRSRSGSIADLVERLEQGLARRGAVPTPVPVPTVRPAVDPAPQAFTEAGDDRLQNAIDSLQLYAARHG